MPLHTRVTEANRKVAAQLAATSQREIKESLAVIGLDWGNEKLRKMCDLSSPDFSIAKLAEAAKKYGREKLREAGGEGTLQQLLRAGIQTAVNDIYQIVPKDFEPILRTVVSDKAVELFAPMFKPGYPRRTDRGEEISAPLQGLAGLDVQFQAQKYAGMLSIERELVEDDQSAQIAQMPTYFGERMAEIESAWCAIRFTGKSGSYGGDNIPASATNVSSETYWPFVTKAQGGFAAGNGVNALTPVAFSQNAVQQADILSMNMLDPLGNLMLVTPTHVIGGPAIKWPLDELLSSPSYASTTSMKQAVSTGVGSDTGIGVTVAKNVMMGKYDPLISRFLPQTYCALVQAGKGFIMLRRSPLEVIQENIASGAAFSNELYRWKIRSRWIPDWLEPRFAVQINDGTVS